MPIADAMHRIGAPHGDSRVRVAVLYQLTVGLMGVFASMVAIAMGSDGDLSLLLTGLVALFLLTALAIAFPWGRVDPRWSILLPIGDCLAIALMRNSDPAAGYSLLWIFPAMCLAGGFGLPGAVGANVLINGLYWLTVALDDVEEKTPVVALIPMMIVAITVTSYSAARRSAYQRDLLDKQARRLARSVEHAQRQELILAEVLDAVDFGVVRFHADGKIAVRNEAHARMHRPSRSEDRTLYAPDGLTVLSEGDFPLERAARGDTFEGELVWHGSPGSGRRALSVTARALRSNDDRPMGTIMVSRDVTEEMMALRAREDLVASVSHELRTPLTSILGYVELALDMDDVPARARRGLAIVERNATRLLAIVADLLSASAAGRIGVQLSISREPTRLDEVVRACVDGLAESAAERRMVIDTSAMEETTAYVDPLRIGQVADNLIGNAIKYAHDGGRIEVGVTSDGDHAWIAVRDHGPGISAEEQQRLFERFFRGDAVRRTSVHGNGLGLAITRDIVHAHGGEITVQSEPGHGATFLVRLPLHHREGRA
ncbi:sensor histidine kinase [Microbacterium sp. NPDC058345]|uniref:sensor histidine kinase n=1 Tax=Microbacterium sp. NPDC058345 TaxID=3346455 RepID=UPI003666D727